MKDTFIQITRHPYEEPHHLNLVILASNGLASGGLEIYSDRTQIKKLGQVLRDLPSHDGTNHLFEIGSERLEDNFGFYFRLRVHGISDRKPYHIQLRMNNNGTPNSSFDETPQLTDFTIKADLYGVKTLGRLLVDFAKLKHQRLLWNPSEGSLDNNLEDPESRTGRCVEAALASLSS